MLSLIINVLAILGVIAILLQLKNMIQRLELNKNNTYTVNDFLMPDERIKSIVNEILVMKNEHYDTKTQALLDKVLKDLQSYNQNERQIKQAWKADKKSWHEARSWYKALQYFFMRNKNA